MNNSFWKETESLQKFDCLSSDTTTDVLIIGGGLAGIMCAYFLEKENIDYILIESDKIASKVTSLTTAKITSQHGFIYSKIMDKYGIEIAQKYYKANEEAINFYREISKNFDFDFEIKNSYVYSVDCESALEDEIEAIDTIGIKAEYMTDIPIPISILGAIRFPLQAQMNPYKFIKNIVTGLKIYENTKAIAYDGNNTIITNNGKIKAQKIIVATHFPFLNKHGSYFLKMYQHRSLVGIYDNAFDIDGMYVDYNDTGMSFRNYDKYLMIGAGGHRTGNKSISFKELDDYANEFSPILSPVFHFANQDCITLDQMPFIGNYSKKTENLYVATGFNKWGMTLSVVAAKILTDRICSRKNEYNDLFSPSRSILTPQLIVNSFEAVKGLVSIKKPRCPHLGCALHWNNVEHSWDCSCHGSRFDKDGKLLNNPATDNLQNKI